MASARPLPGSRRDPLSRWGVPLRTGVAGLASRAPITGRVAGLVLLATLLALAPAGPARAGEADHEQARRALQAGEVMPLAAVLERLARSHPGQVLEVEMEREHGRWVYEIRQLQADGRLVKLEVDARSAEVLRLRGPGAARR